VPEGQPRRMATATAMTECEIMRLEKVAIIRVLHEEPAFSEMFISHLLERTIRVEADVVDQLFNSLTLTFYNGNTAVGSISTAQPITIANTMTGKEAGSVPGRVTTLKQASVVVICCTQLTRAARERKCRAFRVRLHDRQVG
jgi:CRP-like cAMP-binding protein